MLSLKRNYNSTPISSDSSEVSDLIATRNAMISRRKKLYDELNDYSERTTVSTMFLAIFPPGVHCLMSGKIISGLLYMFTGGGFLIWMIKDLLIICSGKFKDKNGKYINSSKFIEFEIKIKNLDEEIRKLDAKLRNYK